MKLDLIEARLMLDFAEAANLSQGKLLERHPNAAFIENKDTDTQCFLLPVKVTENTFEVIVSFRGTEQKLKDWCTDLDGFQLVFPYGNTDSEVKVHRGILKAYQSVREKIHKVFSLIQEKVEVTYVTGHSLGGALSNLCAVDLQYNYHKTSGPVVCYTYGAPRVGNVPFCRSYSNRVPDTYRIFLQNDLVPNLPPKFVEKLINGTYDHVSWGFALGPWNPLLGLVDLLKRKYTKRFSADMTNHSIQLYRKYLNE